MRRNEVRKERRGEAVARSNEISGGRGSGVLYYASFPLHQRILYPLSRTRYTRRSASVNRRCWNSPEIPPSSWFRSGFLAEWTKKAWKKNGACVFWESKRRRQSFECDEIFDFCTRQGNISWSLNESVDENVAQYKRRVSKSRCILSLETISKLI